MTVISRVFFFYILLFSVLFSQSAVAINSVAKSAEATVVHHDILAQIIPEKNEINVIDVITFDKNKSVLTFLLHAGKIPVVRGKGFEIAELTGEAFKKQFPEFTGNITSQNISVSAYRVVFPKNEKKITLEYTLKINHAARHGGEVRDSSGIIFSQGVYLAGESLWYPRFKNELVRFRLSVRLPNGWKSVSQGERKYIEDEKSYHLDVWEENNAQDDIYLIAAKFTEYSQDAGGVNAMAFLRNADDALAKKYLDATAQYLAMYQELLGEYPYKKFALVENFWQTGFGMPSFTLLGQKIIRFPFILYSSYPHELLHNWWGNSVYVNYNEGNWAEGLTAYLADHLMKEQRGRGASHRRSVLQKYTNFTQAGGDFPLKNFVSRYNDVTEAVGYGKTLMMFHMLRLKLGDEVFVQGLRGFYVQHRFSVASYSDIASVFSKVSGKDLTSFFSEWVQRTGAPDIMLENASVNKNADGKYRLTADLKQRQKGAAYPLAIPIAVTLSGQKNAFQKTLVMSRKTMRINLLFDQAPLLIDVDPEFDVFRRLDFNETPPSLSQAFGAAASVIIISSNESPKMKQAYENLAKSWQASRRGNFTINFDSEFDQIPSDKAVWLLGENNKFKADLIASLKEYPFSAADDRVFVNETALAFNENSIILVSRNPLNVKNAFVYISANNVAAVVGLGRKLPHYGKYSYLGFKGDAPTNIAKGQWPTIHSPLSAELSAKSPKSAVKKKASLVKRVPLI